jgi:hypothetical protein
MAAWNNSTFDKVLSTEEESTRFYSEFESSEYVLDVLLKVLRAKYLASEMDTENKDNYGSASWPYRQADLIGYRRAIKELTSLLSLRKPKMTTEEKI